MSSHDLIAPLSQKRNMALQTKRRDGTWVSTPVHLAVDDDRIVFRTWASSGKAQRIRNFPDVRFAPSTLSGKPTGPQLRGRAHLLKGDAERHAADLIQAKYPLLQGIAVPFAHRMRHYETQHYEITDVEQ